MKIGTLNDLICEMQAGNVSSFRTLINDRKSNWWTVEDNTMSQKTLTHYFEIKINGNPFEAFSHAFTEEFPFIGEIPMDTIIIYF